MDRELKIAVVGLGYFSQFHLSAWCDQVGANRIAVTDPNQDRIDWAEEQFGVAGYRDQSLLRSDFAPDIVDIVAPPATHADLVEAYAAKDRIIICQKPFCRTLQEAERVAELAEQAGATLVIHENFRFQPWHRTVKQVLDQGQLGRVLQCRFSLRPGDGQGQGAYLERQPAFRDMPRFLLFETGVHFIDLFRWLFGDIADVYADIRRINPAISGEDAGLLIMGHEGGVQTTFDGNRMVDHATDNPRRTMGEMLIEGEKGCLRLDGYGRLWFRPFGDLAEQEIPVAAKIDENSFGGGCTAALISHVLDATQGRGQLENRVQDYLPVLRVTEAAYMSASTGTKIVLQ